MSGKNADNKTGFNRSNAARTSNYKRKPLPHNGAVPCLCSEAYLLLDFVIVTINLIQPLAAILINKLSISI